MANLGNGAGQELTAQVHADLLLGIMGNGRFVLQTGRQMKATIIDNNTIRIYDGMIVTQGRFVYNGANTYDDFIIETGTQGATRYDIIGYHLYRSDGKELCKLFVQKDVGEKGTVEEAVLRDGAEETFIPMYKVKIVGLTITEIIPMYDKVLTASADADNVLKEYKKDLEAYKKNLDNQFASMQQAVNSSLASLGKTERIEISPYTGSSYYDIDIEENESYYYPGLGIAVINAHVKQTYKKSSSVNYEDVARFGHVNLKMLPVMNKIPVTVSLSGNYTRRYVGMIDDTGFITARTNTAYNPNKGSVYNYYISAVYTVRKEG